MNSWSSGTIFHTFQAASRSMPEAKITDWLAAAAANKSTGTDSILQAAV